MTLNRALSASLISLVVRFVTYSSYGDRTFAAAGLHLWNSLPVQLRNPDISYGLFRWQLKGHLFSEPWTRRSVTSRYDICGALEKHLLTYIWSVETRANGAADHCFQWRGGAIRVNGDVDRLGNSSWSLDHLHNVEFVTPCARSVRRACTVCADVMTRLRSRHVEQLT